MRLRTAARIALPLYVLGIYATLGVARTVTEQIREAGYLRACVAGAFGLTAVLVGWVVLRDPLNRSPRVLAVLAAIAALYGGVVFPMSSPEEKLHFIEYGVAALLAFAAVGEQVSPPRRFALAALITVAAGWGDELVQALLPNRYYDLRDVGFNAAAGALALGALAVVRFVRTPREGSSSVALPVRGEGAAGDLGASGEEEARPPQ